MIPWSKYKLRQRSMNTWEKFTDRVMAHPFHHTFSNYRIRICILLDFLKAENSVYTNPTIVPNPIKNIVIHSNLLEYNNGINTGEDDEFFINHLKPRYDNYPLILVISSKTYPNELFAKIYTESEYMHKDKNIQFEYLYPMEVHVVNILDRIWIIEYSYLSEPPCLFSPDIKTRYIHCRNYEGDDSNHIPKPDIDYDENCQLYFDRFMKKSK